MPESGGYLVGRLTDAPNLRFSQSGMARANFTVVLEHRPGKDGEKQSSFIDCVAWKDIAEHVAESCSKGDRIIVVGTLRQSSWEQDGNKRSKVEYWVDEVGPSLRWATAVVTKDDRNGGKPTAAPAAAKRPAAPPRRQEYQDEEPF